MDRRCNGAGIDVIEGLYESFCDDGPLLFTLFMSVLQLRRHFLQLRKWGWMHHLARHAVACFLTRGDLVSEQSGQFSAKLSQSLEHLQ